MSTTEGGRGASVGGRGGGAVVWAEGLLSSAPWEISALTCEGGDEGGPTPKCRARTEPRSSIGVNILRDLEDRDL